MLALEGERPGTRPRLLDQLRAAHEFVRSLVSGFEDPRDLFRDPSYFKAVRDLAIPLLRTYPSVKVWVAGCSTGEEVWSLAILLEMPGATIIAAIALGQLPPVGIVPAVVLMFAGIVLVIRAGSRTVPSESPPI